MAARDSLYQNVSDDQGVMQRRGPSRKLSRGRVLEVVCDYKHVGSFVTVTGGLMREAAHHTKNFPEFLFAVSGDFFENYSLSTRVRLSLAKSMCDSRLLFGVEGWLCCIDSAIQKLHVKRMIWLRSTDSSGVRSRSDDAEQSTVHKRT